MLKVVNNDPASSHPILSPVQCFPFPGGNHVLALFNPYFHAKSMCW